MNQKTVLITGASSGIGKATARSLASQGYLVYTVARRLEQMADLNDLGCVTYQMDITKEADVQFVVNQIEQERGGVDILINNAGFGLFGAVEDVTMEEARYQLEVNLFGLARLTQLLLPRMRQQKSGKIINISSVGGKTYSYLGSWYHASKHALEGWSDCLRIELKAFNIDVVIIEPGATKTEFEDAMISPLLERSKSGVYGELARKVAQNAQDFFDPNSASSPEVIADLILKAIRAKQPKTRYAGAKLAGPMLFMRRWGSDRLFDVILEKTIS